MVVCTRDRIIAEDRAKPWERPDIARQRPEAWFANNAYEKQHKGVGSWYNLNDDGNSGEWPRLHYEILDKDDTKLGDDINNDQDQPTGISFEKMSKWFATQFGPEQENILNDYLQDPDLKEKFERDPEAVKDFMALRPFWWVIHLLVHSGYRSRPPKWK